MSFLYYTGPENSLSSVPKTGKFGWGRLAGGESDTPARSGVLLDPHLRVRVRDRMATEGVAKAGFYEVGVLEVSALTRHWPLRVRADSPTPRSPACTLGLPSREPPRSQSLGARTSSPERR